MAERLIALMGGVTGSATIFKITGVRKFIEETKPDFVTLSTFVPFPGTDIWNNPQNYNVKRIFKDFSKYRLAVGGFEKELSWLPNIEYFDRSREKLRVDRNILKKYTLSWNENFGIDLKKEK